MSKQVYNYPFIGGEVEMHTEPDPADPARVIITYFLNGDEITKEEAQAMMDEGRRRARN